MITIHLGLGPGLGLWTSGCTVLFVGYYFHLAETA